MESDSENMMTESTDNIMSESPENSFNKSTISNSSFSDEESFNYALGSIKNNDLRKLLDIFTKRLNEQIDRTNFLTRNNNIILSRLADCEQENGNLKKKVKDMEDELENLHDGLNAKLSRTLSTRGESLWLLLVSRIMSTKKTLNQPY